MVFNCGAGKDSSEPPGLQTSQSSRKSVLNIHWKYWCWSSNTLATWSEELSHWERPWCWERLKVVVEGDRGWDGWGTSPTWWTGVWVSSGSWWWTGKPGVLQPTGSQRVGNWATELTDWLSHQGSPRIVWSTCMVSCLQSCLTLCNPKGCSLPGSSVHGILQVRILEFGCHALLQGSFPTQGSNSCLPASPALQVDSLLTESPGKPKAVLLENY